MNVQAIQSIKAEGSAEDIFASTLRELMIAKRINASDLARAVWGTVKDGRGYEVAKNRDRVGHYLAGRSFPSKENLSKIAKVLGVKSEVLEKAYPAPVVRTSQGPKDIQVLFFTDGPHKGSAAMTMTKIALSLKTVTEVMALIESDPVHSAKSKQHLVPKDKKNKK